MARDLTFKLILDSLGFQRGAKQAGDALSKLGKDVKQVGGDMAPLGQSMDWVGGLAAKLTSPVGMATVAVGAFGAGALAAAKGVAELSQQAEKLQLAATRTGIGLQALQQYQRTAQNMGMSLEQVTGAINKMQRAMETNSKALGAAGLELGKIKNLAPEDQFQEIAAQIAAMESPSQRTAAAMAAFGRSGAELLPLLIQVGTEGTDAIVTMSNQQIAALGRVDDSLDDAKGAWADFKNQVFATIAELGGSQGLNVLAVSFRSIAQYIKEASLSSFMKDLLTGNPLWEIIKAGNRSGMYQGRPVASSLWNLSGSTAAASAAAWTGSGKSSMAGIDFGFGDPMALWDEMVLDQSGLGASISKGLSEQERKQKEILDLTKDYNKTLAGIVSGPARGLSDIYADLDEQSENILKASNNTSAALLSGLKGTRLRGGDMLPEVGGLGLWTKYQDVLDQELENAANNTAKVTAETVDWSSNLTALASQLQLLGDVTGGLTGKVASFAAALASGIGGLISGVKAFKDGQKEGGLLGTLGKVVGIAGIAASAIGIGKSIINLFKGDPVKKAQKEAGKALGFNISREMAEAFEKEAKATGKSVSAVAKEWLAAQREELRKQGMAQAKSGVEGLIGAMGASPEIAAIAAKNFSTLFFETVKQEGWVAASSAFSDIYTKLKEHFGDQMPESLKGVERMMSLANNPAVAPYLQASAAQAQFVSGATNAGFVDQSMQGDSAVIARQTLANLKLNGATDKDGYQAIAGLLQSNVNAAIASGQGISAELQALLDEAKANGIDIVADINVQQLDVLRAIYKQLGGTNASVGSGGTPPSGGGNGRNEDPGFANGGFGDFGGGTRAMLHGREAIVPLDANWKPRTPIGGVTINQAPVFHMNPLQSRADQRRIAEFMLREWQRASRGDPLSRRVAQNSVLGGR